MNSRDFCYWLQGFFEIQNPNFMNKYQTVMIREHLNLVIQNDPQPYPFCNFLNGYFKMENPDEINIEKTAIIKTYLNDIFINVLDKHMNETVSPPKLETFY